MNVLSLSSDAVMFLADEPAKGPEFGKASPLGLLIILLLLVAVFLLIRSMNKQLRKLPDSFDADNPAADQAFDDGTDRVDDEPNPDSPQTGSENGAGEGSQDDGGSADRT
ncbi:hypothetical protein [Gordonia neofelifaecis]|uniref:Uncharacterized protein n=1 Tax=Gordonia neofelifaecis NRRL B-59395 TaxID=644548 RepID=F1YFE3_9ACTN|nr:hypothetical protein [Gordonia neofelifaecis]EGD56431.1 hypothetical protein SCNU_02722 [Gordonia neofelifaecis NRRL B-59395]